MRLSLITPADKEPIDLEAVKEYLRITHEKEDTLLKSFIVQARTLAETYTGRVFSAQTWALTVAALSGTHTILSPCFSTTRIIRIPKPPLQEVIEVKVGNETLSSTAYQVDISSSFARVILVRFLIEPITIIFKAGYESLPSDVRQALLILIAQLYEQRQQGVCMTLENPAIHLLDLYRLREVI